MTVLIETVSPPESGRLSVNVEISADILITADDARRKVNRFVTHEIGDLLHAEHPSLVWNTRGAFWRVPVALSAPSKGRIGQPGSIDVDVTTGQLATAENIIAQIEAEAERLAINASL